MSGLELINFYVIPGLISGSIYALGAIGITLIFGILRYAHFAHGDMATLGAYVALGLVGSLALSPWVALPIAMAITALVAVVLDRVFYRHLETRPKILTVMASLGVALMLRSVVQVVWGVDPQVYSTGIVRAESYGGLMLRSRELITFATATGLVLFLMAFLRYTRWGKAMRAMSDNPELARLCGVNNEAVTRLTWVIAGALAAAAGFFLGINTELNTMMGWSALLAMFAAAILGGVGRVEGAVVGGLVIGLVEELSVLVLPSQYKMATAFVILILILLVRPQGIFKGKVL
ncbi:branched-chain amino acid ABC transporter permease [Hydrogenophilus thermoluteolus]|jgi:branched-subunit amino acid ABC-type transport system permease component|uniref:branched-chain amino acid ABC transporter permease n=1 Tax=Hydrogenophilus thiooxidans TaxID=2820326 RepID=UPI000EBF19A9|nr:MULTISPECIES: branched-chain amino acid ABC transporter permease [Hydrogenophilus]MBW7657287.1 branched-chain amino acid ABC transporter permease [Hydrogenophilus thermoluteolus]HCO78098.1 amino acid ABC transporter permease [Rhodocyclaceae bacterium]HNQ49514.1 branched-chain amino acid ABC transporter permease [Hydrogenophilus thermoluteolus]HNU19347.1 branched-chain amino acid ABC transporter permease [Hydrogenophilus thermoluteolus]